MRHETIAGLRAQLGRHIGLRKSRLECFCVLVIGVLVSRTVNLSHLSGTFPTQAALASNYRRLQRFFAQVKPEQGQVARAIVGIAGLGSGPWLLALDRTCWQLGRCHINILMLAVVRNGLAIPLLWQVCDRAGSSTTAERQALLARFCALFGTRAIAGLIGDREFVGAAWMQFLADNDIPFILRIKEGFHVRPADGRHGSGASLFRKLRIGGRRYERAPCRLGSSDKTLAPPVALAATRLSDNSLLIVATNTDPKTALAHYRRRWQIETLFAALKTRGLNLEDTHLTHPNRLATLIGVLALAFSFAHATGEWQAKQRPIVIKKHKRKAKSLFRLGFDLLRHFLIQGRRQDVRCWSHALREPPPNPAGRQLTLQTT